MVCNGLIISIVKGQLVKIEAINNGNTFFYWGKTHEELQRKSRPDLASGRSASR